MNELSLLQHALIVVSNIATLSIASGLILATLVQPRRDRTTTLFALFCLFVALWGLFSLSTVVTELQFGLPADVSIRLMAVSVGFSALAFLLFAIRFTGIKRAWIPVLSQAAPVLVGIGAVLVAVGLAFEPAPAGSLPAMTPLGYGLLVLVIAHAALAFWILSQSSDERVRPLRTPALLLVLAYASAAVESLNVASLDTLLATAAAVWAGWAMLRLQLVKPLEEVGAELRTANLDLRQSLNDLAEERSRNSRLQDELVRASSFKSEFFTGMSHKMRTPLNSIVGYSELLESGVYGQLNEKQADRLHKIYRNGKAMLELINNMLDLGKIEAGRLELQQSVFRLPEVIEEVAAAYRADCQSKAVALEIAVEPELQPLYGDEKRIHQVVTELVENAVKFTASGKIGITAQNVPVKNGISEKFNLPLTGWLKDGEWVVMSIADTGVGIAPEHQARIFDEFFQGGEHQPPELGGTGLGLTICKRLVEMHEGTIWLKSVPEQGSTFFVALPAYVGARETTTATRLTTGLPRSTGSPSDKR